MTNKPIRLQHGMPLYFRGNAVDARAANKLKSGRWNVKSGRHVHWYAMPAAKLRDLIKKRVYTLRPTR